MAYRVEFVLFIQKPEFPIVNTNIGMQGTDPESLIFFLFAILYSLSCRKGAVCPLSGKRLVLLIIAAAVTFRFQRQAFCPVRPGFHRVDYLLQAIFTFRFYHGFIVDMQNDREPFVLQIAQGVGQDIPGDSLHNILRQTPAVDGSPFPFPIPVVVKGDLDASPFCSKRAPSYQRERPEGRVIYRALCWYPKEKSPFW